MLGAVFGLCVVVWLVAVFRGISGVFCGGVVIGLVVVFWLGYVVGVVWQYWFCEAFRAVFAWGVVVFCGWRQACTAAFGEGVP